MHHTGSHDIQIPTVYWCARSLPNQTHTFLLTTVLILGLLSQMATYWFVIGWLDIQKAQKSKV